MFNASRLRRSAILGALGCALLAASSGDAAAAQTEDDTLLRGVRAQQRYYEGDARNDPSQRRSDISPGLTAAQLQALEALERHYSTYGEPEPIAAPTAPEPADGTPWLTIALVAAVALAVASIAAIHRRRLRLRRVARATT
jgi:hypothetical protein